MNNLTPEERRRLAREVIEEMEREAREWVENDDRRIREAREAKLKRLRAENTGEPLAFKKVGKR